MHVRGRSRKAAPPYSSGDGRPLKSSLTRLFAPGTGGSGPVCCYEQSVANRSARDVTNVFWGRGWICQGAPSRQRYRLRAAAALGHLKIPCAGFAQLRSGTRHYPTTVYAPANGWTGKQTCQGSLAAT